VYGFVKQSRGQITLKSMPGEGTTVALYLRRAVPTAVKAETVTPQSVG
jgi:signal transduction histidine kinase